MSAVLRRFVSHRRRGRAWPESRRLLVVKFGDIGDVLNITPALRALRARYPAARIDVLTTRNGRQALARSSFHDSTVPFDKAAFDRLAGATSLGALWAGVRLAWALRRGRYDTLLLLNHLITPWGTLKYTFLALLSGAPRRVGLDNGRGWFLTDRALDRGFGAMNERRYWLTVTALLGATLDDDRPVFALTAEDRAAARALLARARSQPGQPVVVVHPTTGPYARSRQWPAARFAAVADRLAREAGAAIVLVGGPDALAETAALARMISAPALDLAGRTELPVTAAVLAGANLVVANESAIGHLAAALGTPVLTIVGPSNEAAWAPYGAERVVLPLDSDAIPDLPATASLTVRCADPHAPCLYVGYGPGNPRGCPHCRCLGGIDAERIATIALRLLAAPSGTNAARAGRNPNRSPVV